jgi:hypothetical protein
MSRRRARAGLPPGRAISRAFRPGRHSSRQSITVPESEVLDWTIARPDGSEEGNFIGKYLDSHRSGTAK